MPWLVVTLPTAEVFTALVEELPAEPTAEELLVEEIAPLEEGDNKNV